MERSVDRFEDKEKYYIYVAFVFYNNIKANTFI